MTPVELSRTVLRAVRCAVDEGELSVAVPERAVVTSPGPGGCGDYATNIALQLARPAGRAPRQVAEILRTHLRGAAGVSEVAITGPGFLNISLNREATQEVARTLVSEILKQSSRYGYAHEGGDTLAGHVIALRVPRDTRAEVLADTLVRIIATQGGCAEVHHDEPVDLRPVPAPEDPAPLGHDAARWALLHPAPHDRPRITADHLVQRESNPLFRVRYAHARTRALSRNAAALGFDSAPGDVSEAQDLLAPLAEYPRVLSAAATHRAPDRLARHLVTTADALLDFQHTVLPVGDEKPSAAHRARLALAEAAGTVLAGGLSLLGISAPEHL
ncbi:ArgS-related anticodon-binding protein NrtL [Streptomyces sp. NBC_00620]|uniref:ArgS-related anticodon-binding protein NrtL n=1 Tax=unclassified Streptomyces TaxID=2593676 RepID=UPI0022595BB1|nr:DALR anticodon-binding domain-containing protein [Streptomyces sp. NBC_00620]MCX4971399.1 DALR anticodon-binding domain-containing protein [Streptomyces sp. NBC_00620]WUC14064.1 DALR anticodon-binding domain-containing protein [Streptomyces sp. NBC_00564]